MPKKRTPSPSKPISNMVLADKLNSDSEMFGEWQILREQCEGLKEYYVKSLGTKVGKTLSVFAVGSPRAARIVVTLKFRGAEYRKVIIKDIRDGSWHTWLDELDSKQWDVVQVFKVTM